MIYNAAAVPDNPSLIFCCIKTSYMGGGGSKSKASASPQPIIPEAEDEKEMCERRLEEEANAARRVEIERNKGTPGTAPAPAAAQPKSNEMDEQTSVAKELEAEDLSESVAENLPPLRLNFTAIKDLWFTAANGGRGRSLVELKDMCQSSRGIFHRLFNQHTNDPEDGMIVSEFQAFIVASGTDLDEDSVKSQFFESAGYPDDEDDEAQVNAVKASPGIFATAVVRVANAYVMQEFGESEKNLCEQLSDWFNKCKEALSIQDEEISSVSVRDASFFAPPTDFVGTHPRVFMDLSVSGDDGAGGRIVIELNGEVEPKAAYNFKCLCTGERGVGELTGLPLSLKGSKFHRLVAGMCLQGGDIEGSDGYGGESVYGGEFEDSEFTLKHDDAGVVSCGNSGPNTNTSQFFFTLGPASHLDGENVAFGRVVEGLDIVLALGNCEVDDEEVPTQVITVEDCGLA